jgi:hypothetical protein
MAYFIGKLDKTSQRSLCWTGVRIFFLILLWVLPWLSGTVSLKQIVAALNFMFALTSVLAIGAAVVRREKCGGASFNSWDEALTFTGLSILMHAAHRLMPN